MKHILVSLSSSSPAEPIESYADLQRLIYRYSSIYKVSFQEAYNTLMNSHNRYGGDPIYGPGYCGPRRLADHLTDIARHEENKAQIRAFLLGGIAAIIWLAGLLWLLMSL